MPSKNTENYNSEPVVFCAKCYSLNIRYEEQIGTECCAECGCTDTCSTNIYEWEKLYENRYGEKYLKNSFNIKDSPIFQMTTKELKVKVYNHYAWRTICSTLYPNFPKLSRMDSVLHLFSLLLQENKLDNLKYLLVKLEQNGRR